MDQAAVAQGEGNVQFLQKRLQATQSVAQSWTSACSQDQRAIQQATSQAEADSLQSQQYVDCNTAETDQADANQIQVQLQQAQSDLQMTEIHLQQDEQG